MAKKEDKVLLTVSQVAERLGVGTSSIRTWLIAGSRFPNARHYGPVWLIPESDLKGFVKRGRGRPRKTPASKKPTTKR
jgi:excisionase family DNA binding protein